MRETVISNYRTLHHLLVLRIAFEPSVALLIVVTFLSKRYFSQFGMFSPIALLSAGALWLVSYLIQVQADREYLLNHRHPQALWETDTDLYRLQRFYLIRMILAERLVLGIATTLSIVRLHMS